MAKQIELTTDEQVIVRMAIRQWTLRCESEAAVMEKFAAEYRAKGEKDVADKAEANAAASRRMKAEAEALLESGKL